MFSGIDGIEGKVSWRGSGLFESTWTVAITIHHGHIIDPILSMASQLSEGLRRCLSIEAKILIDL